MKVLVVFNKQARWMEEEGSVDVTVREIQLKQAGFDVVELDTSQIQLMDLVSSHHPMYQYFTKKEIIDFLKAATEREMTYEVGQKVLIKKLCFDPNNSSNAGLAEMSNQIGTIAYKMNGLYFTTEWWEPLRHEEIVREATLEDYIGHYVMIPDLEDIGKIIRTTTEEDGTLWFHVETIARKLRFKVYSKYSRLINPECITDSITGKRFFKYTYWMYYESAEPEFYTLADLVMYWNENSSELITERETFDSWFAEMEKMQIYNKRTRVWTED